ncbi:MAG TPA: polysaccharide deacetylase family protein [Dongiaceae bacterium]|nr:polysaccharide deacetylase family protein [Dongiaceae bacterium]
MLGRTLFILVNLLFSAAALGASHGVVLQYHHVSEHSPPSTSVSPAVFKRQMQFLKDNGFTVWPLSKLVDQLLQDQPVPDGTVAITFDDAYLDIRDQAVPVLQQHNFPFTLFVATDFVDQGQKGYLSWDDLRALKRQGAELAGHTRAHAHLLRRQSGEDEAAWLDRIKAQIDGAETLLQEKTGEQLRLFAFPYGEADETLIAKVKEWGYVGFGQQSGALSKALLQGGFAPRFPFNVAYSDMTEFQHKASSLPLPVKTERADATIWSKAVRPRWELGVAPQVKSLSCYVTGQAAADVQKAKDGVFHVRAKKDIGVGRSRYNCTSPVAAEDLQNLTLKLKPRFYWYSHQWIRKQDDGEWYPEP